MHIRKKEFCKILKQQRKLTMKFLRQRKTKRYSSEEFFLAISPNFYDELAEKMILERILYDFLSSLKLENRKNFFEYLSDEKLQKVVCGAPEFVKNVSPNRLERLVNAILYDDELFVEFVKDVRRMLALMENHTLLFRLLSTLNEDAIIAKIFTDATVELFGENNFEKLIEILEINPNKIFNIFQKIDPDNLIEVLKKCNFCVLKKGKETGLNSYICNILTEFDLNELLQEIKKSEKISISDVFTEEEIAQLETNFFI